MDKLDIVPKEKVIDVLKDEKIAFILGLLVAGFTLIGFFKGNNFIFLHTPFYNFNLYDTSISFTLFLGASLYIYAFLYSVFNISYKVLKLADVLYTFALFIPIGVLILFVIDSLNQYFGNNMYGILSLIISVIVYLLTFYSGYKKVAENRKMNVINSYENKETGALNDAENLWKAGEYNASLIESFKSIEIALQKALLYRGIDYRPMTITSLIDITIKNKLLDVEDKNDLKEARDIRNKAVHTGQKFSSRDSLFVLNVAKRILYKIREFTSS